MKRLAVLGVVVLAGCAGIQALYYTPLYDLALVEVTGPTQLQQPYGKQRVTPIDNKYFYEDDVLKTAWLANEFGVGFALRNKTNHSIKLVWAESSFVGPDGSASRLSPFVDGRSVTESFTVVPAGALLSAQAYCNTLLPYSSGPEKEVLTLAAAVRGKRVKLLLPIAIESLTHEYTLTFEVKSAGATRPLVGGTSLAPPSLPAELVR